MRLEWHKCGCNLAKYVEGVTTFTAPTWNLLVGSGINLPKQYMGWVAMIENEMEAEAGR